MNTKKYRTVSPCGMLQAQGKEYFLLYPYPLSKDSWERDECYRWAVVPRVKHFTDEVGAVYPIARHVVITSPFIVEYALMPEIIIEVAKQDDITETEWFGMGDATNLPTEPDSDLLEEYNQSLVTSEEESQHIEDLR